MVTLDYIREQSARFDTALARAFRRALGLAPVWFRAPVGCVASLDTAAEIEECFRNYGSPMDW